jgi:hypothetical protein
MQANYHFRSRKRAKRKGVLSRTGLSRECHYGHQKPGATAASG